MYISCHPRGWSWPSKSRRLKHFENYREIRTEKIECLVNWLQFSHLSGSISIWWSLQSLDILSRSASINWLPMFLKVCDIPKINVVLGKAAQCEMWSSNPVISIKLPQQLVGERCHVPLNTWPACVKISFIVLYFLAAKRKLLLRRFQTSLDTSCLFIFTVWRWDVFWFLLDMTNDDRIPLRMTFDNLGDNISRCHSFIWHPALTQWPARVSSPRPRLASDSAWILNTNDLASCLFENHQNVLVLNFPTQPSCKISSEANISNLSFTRSHRDSRACLPRPLPASSGCPWSPWAPSALSSSSPRCRASRAPRLPRYKTRPQETFLNERKYLCFLRFSFGTLHCTGSFKMNTWNFCIGGF